MKKIRQAIEANSMFEFRQKFYSDLNSGKKEVK
jgi:queuine/archaeosine tRNA-ribosyltransferase